ncbi:unnamed protein product, partial [Phaeothamnion confervicola]
MNDGNPWRRVRTENTVSAAAVRGVRSGKPSQRPRMPSGRGAPAEANKTTPPTSETPYDPDAAAADALRGALSLSLQAAQRLARRLEGRDDAMGLVVLLKGAFQVALQAEQRRNAAATRLNDALSAVAQLRTVMSEQREALQRCTAVASPPASGRASLEAASGAVVAEGASTAERAANVQPLGFGFPLSPLLSPRRPSRQPAITGEDREGEAGPVATADTRHLGFDSPSAAAVPTMAVMVEAATTAAAAQDAAAEAAAAASAELEHAKAESHRLQSRALALEREVAAERDRREVAETLADATRRQEEAIRKELASAEAAWRARLDRSARQNQSLCAVVDRLEAIVTLQQDCLVRRRPAQHSRGGGDRSTGRTTGDSGAGRRRGDNDGGGGGRRSDRAWSERSRPRGSSAGGIGGMRRAEGAERNAREGAIEELLADRRSGGDVGRGGGSERSGGTSCGYPQPQRRNASPGRPPLAPIYVGPSSAETTAVEAAAAVAAAVAAASADTFGQGVHSGAVTGAEEDATLAPEEDWGRRFAQRHAVDVNLNLSMSWPPPGGRSSTIRAGGSGCGNRGRGYDGVGGFGDGSFGGDGDGSGGAGGGDDACGSGSEQGSSERGDVENEGSFDGWDRGGERGHGVTEFGGDRGGDGGDDSGDNDSGHRQSRPGARSEIGRLQVSCKSSGVQSNLELSDDSLSS